MTGWEYMTLELSCSPHSVHKWTYEMWMTLPNGSTSAKVDVSSGAKKASVEKLNELGSEGWEVFDIQTLNGAFVRDIEIGTHAKVANWLSKSYWLKRPLTTGLLSRDEAEDIARLMQDRTKGTQ